MAHRGLVGFRWHNLANTARAAREVLVSLFVLFGATSCSEGSALPPTVDADAGRAGGGGDGGSGIGGGGIGGSGIGGGDAGANPTPNSEPDFAVPSGAIRVTTWLRYGETQLAAFFADVPELSFHRESERVGQCRLMTYQASTCTPACTGGDACVGQQCQPYPVRRDRGPIDWEWPGGRQTVSASDILGYHAIGEARTPGDVIVRVDGLTLSAPSDDAPTAETDWGAAVNARAAGADVALRWTDPSPSARVRLHMTDCTGSHGGFAAAELECEGPDSGTLVLPGAFLDRLAAGDWSHGECGAHTFERYRVATSDADDTFRIETIAPADFFYRPD